MANEPDRQPAPRATLLRAAIEFAIVGGGALFMALYLIPAQTVPSDNFGLSPRMVPTVCAAVIGGVALLNLLGALIAPSTHDQAVPRRSASGLLTVLALLAATAIGIAVIHYAGLTAGGTVLVLLASLALGEFRPLMLGAMGGGAFALLMAVDWIGL